MASAVVIPTQFGAVSRHFANNNHQEDSLGSGIMSGFGVIKIKGKVWSTDYAGELKPMLRADGDGARGSIEVVILKSSPVISKIYYAGGYVDGSEARPNCWSTNGVTPDANSEKIHSNCGTCPMNQWGARITESGKQGKACTDSKRIAVVTLDDIDNEIMGGPMLLRVPAASLKDLKSYGEKLSSIQYPYYAVGTRIAFDVNEAYPKFVFGAIRALSDEEAQKVLALRDDPRVERIIAEAAENAGPAPAPQNSAASVFEQPPMAAPKPAPAPAPVAEPVAEPVKAAPKKAAPKPAPAPVAEQSAAPASFDALLDNLM
jgi:hypothetical protein